MLARILVIFEVLSVIFIVDLFAMNTYFTPPINQAWLIIHGCSAGSSSLRM